MEATAVQTDKVVVLFDGDCNLCNGTVQYIIDRDKKDLFRFAALQSEFGKNLLVENQYREDFLDSFILYYSNQIFDRSTAALHMFKQLGGLYAVAFYLFIAVPKPIRDAVYSFIGRNRYKWFGKSEYCRVMTPDLVHKFIR